MNLKEMNVEELLERRSAIAVEVEEGRGPCGDFLVAGVAGLDPPDISECSGHQDRHHQHNGDYQSQETFH